MSPDPDLSPYRVMERIGAGGMGEVFLAHDERLGRRVAIKRLRLDREVDSKVRERLRREARYVARLSHPSIVQVHDVLERDGVDYIVMEWVDGENLRRRLEREGPQPIQRVIDVARQLAGGLAEAHRRGIVHRDLKAENVLVDAAGRAKITDFGIAKRLSTGVTDDGFSIPGGSRFGEALTEDSAVLGTYRSMSPEQALAEPVDPRSDLFSLGVLLYEMLTGRTPFEARGALETLRRVVEQEPAPAESLRPQTPPALARLVWRLLRKEPELRPRSAGEVEHALAELATGEETLVAGSVHRPRPPAAGRRRLWSVAAAVAGLVVLTAGVLLLQRRAPPVSATPIYVAAMTPEVRMAGDEEPPEGGLDVFAEAVRVAMVRGLIALEGVSAKATSEIDRVGGDPITIARSVAADELVGAEVVYRAELAQVSLSRLRVADGVVLASASFEVPTDDLLLVVRSVSAGIRAAYPESRLRPGTPGLDVPPDALHRFVELRRAFLHRDDPVGDDLLESIAELRRATPNFFDLDLLEAQVALYRFHDSRDPQHLARARSAVERARSAAPDDPRTLRQAFELERRAGNLEATRALLDALATVQAGDVQILDLQARLLQSEGRAAQALEAMREAARRRPSLDRLVDAARLEMALGEVAAARAHLHAALERSPDYFEALSLLAELELGTGDPAVAAELYRRLVERSAGPSELSNLGVALMLLGDYRAAASQFRRALEVEPRNPFFTLNLADSLHLAGDVEEARALYRRVVEQVGDDPAAENAQFLTVEAQALAHLERPREAVEALRRALQQAPDHAGVAYEASLVYALIGEDTSARVYAEEALARGVDRRWFDFPWFDALRREGAFPELAGEPSGRAPPPDG